MDQVQLLSNAMFDIKIIIIIPLIICLSSIINPYFPLGIIIELNENDMKYGNFPKVTLLLLTLLSFEGKIHFLGK